ncbi:hypothetical protein, partial [Lysinibacillus agricola]|uniref:hypothetical protein n=1 Tax=Lysinibacillus agricola TaxID=2590012 RepID=UPI003C19EEFA
MCQIRHIVFSTKANQQLQMSSARKRSVSSKCLLRESEASAANVFCAKAKRQLQLSSVAKAKRQLQLSSVA